MLQPHPPKYSRRLASASSPGRPDFWILTLVFALGLVGCRGAFSPNSQLRPEPSFDRLLELESSSEMGQSANRADRADRDADVGEAPSPHPQVAQRRPGGRSAASRHTHEIQGDSAPSSSNAYQSQKPVDGSGAARRAISDDTEQEASEESDKHSSLLQQTQKALRNRYVSDQNASPTLPVADDQNAVTIRLSDTGPLEADSSENPADQPETFVVAASHRPGKSQQDAGVQLAAHNRYRTNPNSTEPQITTETQIAVEPQITAEPQLPQEEASISAKVGQDQTELRWEQHVQEAIKKLSVGATADGSGPTTREATRQAVIQRLLALALGDREQMTSAVNGLQPQEQEYFKYQLTAILDAIDPDANPVSSRRWSLVMLNQRKAHEHLSSLSNLEVSNLSFCTQVESFGVAERFTKYQFTPDQEVLLYCELDNFVSERSKDGKGFETQLQGSYEIVDSNGSRVADQSLPMDSHVCRNRRRDYFIAYRIYMPQNIGPGNYSLRLTIEDIKGRKFGQSEIAFQIQ